MYNYGKDDSSSYPHVFMPGASGGAANQTMMVRRWCAEMLGGADHWIEVNGVFWVTGANDANTFRMRWC